MSNTYTEWQTQKVLEGCGVDIRGETYHDFTVLCPFHGNTHTPSLSVSKEKGNYICFNPSCGETGNLADLVKFTTKRNDYEALRYIISKKDAEPDLESIITTALTPDTKGFNEFPQGIIDRCYSAMNDKAREYMYGRGFNDATLDFFKVGFSAANDYHPDLITVPMHSPDGIPVGFIGRGIEGKVFKNSSKLPTSRTWFNLHRAKRASATVIITEASFDALKVHQAGFPGVIANLSGHVNAEKMSLLDRYFTKLIIATDMDEIRYDDPCRVCKNKSLDKCQGHNSGRDLGLTIARALPHKEIWWAADSYKVIYPHGAKDTGDLTDQEIKHVITNSVPNVEYIGWDVY